LIDITFSNDLKPDKGKILISDPFLDDDYFRRSLIYLCEFNKEGSFGFVINNFISINLNDLDESFPEIETQISLGGPMEINSLYFIHTLGEKINNSLLIDKNIFLGGDFQQLSSFIKEDESIVKNIRFFIGYSGWGANQLETEIQNNSWIVSELNSSTMLFGSQSKLSWKRYMYDLGGKFKIISKFPIDPRDN
jgi:putative transcriptional regulator